jgi:NIPSNAP
MFSKKWSGSILVALAFASGFGLRGVVTPTPILQASAANRVFEIRTYTAPDGKLDALKARFRDHTISIFKKHNMVSIGYFTPQDAPLSQNTLIYVLAHPSRDAAKTNWAAFNADPEWVTARTASEVNGKLTTGVTSVFVDPTDFSPIK